MTAWVRPTDEHWTLCLCDKIWFLSRRRSCGYSSFGNKAGTSWWYKRLWRIQPSHQRGFERCNNYTMAEMCVSTDMPEGTSLSLPRPVLLPIRPSFHTLVGSQKRRATVDWQKPWERSLRVTSIYILLHLLTRDRNWDRGGSRGIRRGILHKPMLYNPKLKFTVNAGLILQTFSKW